jgi:hypothetical protein
MFTDFTYDNLGIPKNPQNPFYVEFPNWIDKGLGGFLETVPMYSQYAAENMGKHKVPSLRNVDLRPTPDFIKAYGHNGLFKSLKDIVHFYNTRDVDPTWDTAEVSANVNTAELGNLKLTEDDEWAIVAFLKTLSDGYIPDAGKELAAINETKIILQNTPNPFNPSTVISFKLPEANFVTLKVYNLIGQEVKTLMNGYETAGLKSITFNAGNLPSGLYFYRLQYGNSILQNKMLLIK